jgi:LAS superfamily LD-carboxypeptidase LdcB
VNGLVYWLRPYAEYLVSLYPQLRVTSVYRSYSEQLALWNNRARNPYPVAPPGQSYHQYGRAFDLGGPASQLAAAGATWRSWGGTWSPADAIHFQA